MPQHRSHLCLRGCGISPDKPVLRRLHPHHISSRLPSCIGKDCNVVAADQGVLPSGLTCKGWSHADRERRSGSGSDRSAHDWTLDGARLALEPRGLMGVVGRRAKSRIRFRAEVRRCKIHVSTGPHPWPLRCSYHHLGMARFVPSPLCRQDLTSSRRCNTADGTPDALRSHAALCPRYRVVIIRILGLLAYH